jgi:hypothetical protein
MSACRLRRHQVLAARLAEAESALQGATNAIAILREIANGWAERNGDPAGARPVTAGS